MVEVLESRIAPAATNLNLADLNGSNGFKFSGLGEFDASGKSVSDAGDVNGDGFADVIVGTIEAGLARSSPTYVLFGSGSGFAAKLDAADINGTNGFQISSAGSVGFAGTSVSGAGDINGDGFDDLLIGAPFVQGQVGGGTGVCYVVFGKAAGFPATVDPTTLNGTNGFKIGGIRDDFPRAPLTGYSVSGAGDVNGDGFEDVIIGVQNSRYSGIGSSYVLFGKAAPFAAEVDLTALNGTDGFRLTDGDSGLFGTSVSGAGDVNGDGLDDLVIGAPTSSSDYNEGRSGASYVVFGNSAGFVANFDVATLDGINGFKLTGGDDDEGFGFSVSGAGDINGDGFGDLIVGAMGAKSKDSGASYVIFGAAVGFAANIAMENLDGVVGFKIIGAAAGDYSGISVSGAGDINNDGFNDLIVGAAEAGQLKRDAGSSYVIFGKRSGFVPELKLASIDGTIGFRIKGVALEDQAGRSVSGAGDINGDGFDDLIIGAPGAGPNGAAYVVFGFDSRLDVNGENTAINFQDVDGDTVTIKVGKGEIVPQDVVIGPDGQLQLLKLAQAGDRFEGATIKITAKKGAGGDGFVNVGAIDAAGLNLAKVVVKGDLGQLDVGTESLSKAALKSLTVRSLGVLGDSTQIPGTVDPLLSEIAGSLPKFTVKTDVKNAVVDVTGKLGAVKIGGNLTGDADAGAAVLRSLTEFGRIVPRVAGGIPGSVQAGNIDSFSLNGFMNGGSVQSAGDIGSVSVGAGIMGGGAVAADGRIPVVKVVGGLASDDAARPAVVAALARLGSTRPKDAVAIDSMLVRGDVENARVLLGYNKEEVAKNPDASAGSVVVKGDWTATSLVAGVFDATNDGFGLNDTPVEGDTTPSIVARIASVVIKGTATGSATEGDHFGITAQAIGKLSIDGEKVALSKTEKDDILLDPVNGDFRVVEV